jgi:hypothetical protein
MRDYEYDPFDRTTQIPEAFPSNTRLNKMLRENFNIQHRTDWEWNDWVLTEEIDQILQVTF